MKIKRNVYRQIVDSYEIELNDEFVEKMNTKLSETFDGEIPTITAQDIGDIVADRMSYDNPLMTVVYTYKDYRYANSTIADEITDLINDWIGDYATNPYDWDWNDPDEETWVED